MGFRGDYNVNIQMFYDLCLNKHLSPYYEEIENLIKFFEKEEIYEICMVLKNLENNLN
tara:strand:- start:801 stop:974 length:174 start_codon:yes stop_codon:yes gene_type:complete